MPVPSGQVQRRPVVFLGHDVNAALQQHLYDVTASTHNSLSRERFSLAVRPTSINLLLIFPFLPPLLYSSANTLAKFRFRILLG